MLSPIEEGEKCWTMLNEGFTLLHERKLNSKQWMEMYNNVHSLFSNDDNEESGIREIIWGKIVNFIENICLTHRKELFSISNESVLLQEYVARWCHYASTCRTIRGICAYPHRFYVLSHRNCTDLFLLSLIKWKEACFIGLEDKLFNAFLGLKTHHIIEEELLSGLIESFASFTVSEHNESKLDGKLAIKTQDKLVQAHITTLKEIVNNFDISVDRSEDKCKFFAILSSLPDDELINKMVRQQELEQISPT